MGDGWRACTRITSRQKRDAARYDQTSRAGLARWLAADAALTVNAAMQHWRQEYLLMRKQRSAEAQLRLAEQARTNTLYASKWREEANNAEAKKSRIWRTAEGA